MQVSDRSVRGLTTLFLICSLVLNILLALAVANLKRSLAYVKSEGQLRIGGRVPPIIARDLEGQYITVDYRSGDPPTILYILTPKCGWCQRNSDNIRALAGAIGKGHRVVGLSLSTENLQAYSAGEKLGFPIYSQLTQETMLGYRLGTTPQTIVVSPEGRVLKNWMGAYTGDLKVEIENYFQARLPGITDIGGK